MVFLPDFFFVSANNAELARRLEQGLQTAVDNDFYLQHMNAYYADPLVRIGIEQRIVLTLENPYLSDTTRQIALDAVANYLPRWRHHTRSLD